MLTTPPANVVRVHACAQVDTNVARDHAKCRQGQLPQATLGGDLEGRSRWRRRHNTDACRGVASSAGLGQPQPRWAFPFVGHCSPMRHPPTHSTATAASLFDRRKAHIYIRLAVEDDKLCQPAGACGPKGVATQEHTRLLAMLVSLARRWSPSHKQLGQMLDIWSAKPFARTIAE